MCEGAHVHVVPTHRGRSGLSRTHRGRAPILTRPASRPFVAACCRSEFAPLQNGRFSPLIAGFTHGAQRSPSPAGGGAARSMSHHFDTQLATRDPRLNVADAYLFDAAPDRTVMVMICSTDRHSRLRRHFIRPHATSSDSTPPGMAATTPVFSCASPTRSSAPNRARAKSSRCTTSPAPTSTSTPPKASSENRCSPQS
jgi:hypothetical protein